MKIFIYDFTHTKQLVDAEEITMKNSSRKYATNADYENVNLFYVTDIESGFSITPAKDTRELAIEIAQKVIDFHGDKGIAQQVELKLKERGLERPNQEYFSLLKPKP